MKNVLRTLLVAAVGALATMLISCNTMEGAGEDIESAGEAIQRGADND